MSGIEEGQHGRIKKHNNLFLFNVDEPVIRDVLVAQWLEWWDAAEGLE